MSRRLRVYWETAVYCFDHIVFYISAMTLCDSIYLLNFALLRSSSFRTVDDRFMVIGPQGFALITGQNVLSCVSDPAEQNLLDELSHFLRHPLCS